MTPLADLEAVLTLELPAADAAAAEAARTRQAVLTKPPGSLGRLEDLAVFMAGWQGRARPRIDRAQALVFAGNHGICARGVNPYPQAVTALMVENFRRGGAAINQLCRAAGADLTVVPLELDRPTADFTAGPAMAGAECLAAFNRGAAAVTPDADVLILGEMGIGNSTVWAALAHALFGGASADWVGRGTGADEAMRARKAAVVGEEVARHAGLPPLALLAAARWVFPLVSLATGAIVWAVLHLALWMGLAALPAAALGILAVVLVTGGLHHDGLADLADGLAGGRDRADALRIVRDSRIGSFGALALVLAVGLGAAALVAATEALTPAALMLAAVASRPVMLAFLIALPPSRAEGLGEDAARGSRADWLAGAIATLALALAVGPAAIPALLAAAGAGGAVAARAARRLGGQTGD